jgi:ATP-dependent helicase/DNAse subunit B
VGQCGGRLPTYAQTMALELIVGPPNSGRAGELFSSFRTALDRRPILVVPTGDDVVTFERELCSSDAVALGGTIGTFAALAREVTRALGVAIAPPLTVPQRQALVRAAIRRERPQLLRRSAARPGFAPALDVLIAELQSALLSPAEFARIAAELEQPGHETELARLYGAYVELREATGRGDDGSTAEAAIAALRAEPQAWDARPVFVYGFDDLSRAQLELIDALAGAGEVTVAVAYEDRRALTVRAPLLSVLRDELGAAPPLELPFEPEYTASQTLRHLDQNLFEPEAETVAADDGLVLLESAGARGEAEAIGIEIARLLARGYEPDQIAIVTRHPESAGPLLASVLRELGLPVALEASLPLADSCVGASLIALCRAAQDEGAIEALLSHLRLDPALDPGIVDGAERRVRRGDAQTVSDVTARWQHPPRHLARLRDAADAKARLLALARSARELAERPHAEQAPLASAAQTAADGVPFSAFELRAGVAAAQLLGELATVGELRGCEPADLGDAAAALESASVPAWRGPASGRIRILSPYRARATRVRALFVASLQDGEFPSAGPGDPLLSEERRREIGHRDLRRADPAEQERYLFFACVSRPTDRLYLSWQSCDEDGGALAPSPFVDEVLDLVSPAPPVQVRGLERAVPAPDEATSARTLARALAVGGWSADRDAALARLGVPGDWSEQVRGLFAGVPDPDELPGPLHVPAVLDELGAREVFSANSLEGWVECPYRWFVDHELSPQRLEPEADPLWLGGIVHRALELLYREAPGEDSIPRPGDVERWRRRFGELLEEQASSRVALNRSRRAALDRLRVQVEAFLDTEAHSESAFRPKVLELGFGPMDTGDGEDELADALAIGDVFLRGRIDRIDLAPDGQSAIVRDYKTGKNVPRAEEFGERGKLQIQLYMRVAQRVMGLDPVAGLYQPLGASGPSKRKARGIALRDDERLDGVELVSYDRRDPDDFAAALDHAEATAAAAAAEMRRGLIDRRPVGGQCPKYCTFQPICRLERALGAVGESSGNGEREQ